MADEDEETLENAFLELNEECLAVELEQIGLPSRKLGSLQRRGKHRRSGKHKIPFNYKPRKMEMEHKRAEGLFLSTFKEQLLGTFKRLKNEWWQNDRKESETQDAVLFIKYIVKVGCPPHNENDMVTGMSTKKLQEHCGKVIKVLKILKIILNHIELKVSAELVGNQLSSRCVFKAVACPLVVLCAMYMMPSVWSHESPKPLAKELLSVICTGCHCHSVSELLSGFAEASESTAKNIARDHDMPLLFPRGLLRLILDYLWPQLTKQTWKRHPSSLYALTWCVQQVQHPFLGEHFPKLLPALLLLVDDYQIENKVLGIRCLNHVVDNVNAAELRWYGRADVIFEALQRLIYTNEPDLIRVLHPCVLSVLRVIEDSPHKAKPGRKANKCDSVFQVVLSSLEFEGKTAMRRAYALHLKDFVDHMGITILRHFKRLLQVIFSHLAVYDGPDEIVRISLLDCLQMMVLHAWPRIPHHSEEIMKSLLKLLVDITDSRESISQQVHDTLTSRIARILALLRLCCGKSFEEQLQALKEGVGHEETERCVASVLIMDIESLENTNTRSTRALVDCSCRDVSLTLEKV